MAFDGVAASTGVIAVGIIAGPNVFGITSRMDRESRGQPSPTSGTAASIFARGSVQIDMPGEMLLVPHSGWASLIGRHRAVAS